MKQISLAPIQSRGVRDMDVGRAATQLQVSRLWDMRSGSISNTGGKCGNPRCHCLLQVVFGGVGKAERIDLEAVETRPPVVDQPDWR